MTRPGSPGAKVTRRASSRPSETSTALEAVLAATRGPRQAVATATDALSVGIGHTRWATHGAVTEQNAHPHEDASGRFRIVLNGIIENHLELRDRLAADLVALRSDTDAEVVAHLIALNYDGDLADAVRRSLADLEGHYAMVAMYDGEPGALVGVRRECPLVVGLGAGEQFIASSISAFLSHTREVAVLRDGEIAVLRADGVLVFDLKGLPHRPASTEVDWNEDLCEKDGFETFMLKEIHEQATAVRETVSQWRANVERNAAGGLAPDRLRKVSRVIVVGCGTSYHAGLAGTERDRALGSHPRRRRGGFRVSVSRPDRRERIVRARDLRSPERQPTRSLRCGWPESAGPRCWRSPTRPQVRRPATRTASCSRALGWRSGWRRPRPSSRRWYCCMSWRST